MGVMLILIFIHQYILLW